MQDGTLLLGPVLFQDFEVPERVTWGGEQRLAVHRLPGGERIVDALGRDDAEITWSGIFSGPDAAIRARLLDTLRTGGGVWLLTWNAFFFSVVVNRFSAEYARDSWVPYRIACTVLRDEAAAVADAVTSLAGDALADLAAATGFAGSVDLGPATLALGASGAVTASTAPYAAAVAALADASNSLDANVAYQGALLIAATDPATAATAAGQAAALANARSYVRRAAVNLANASS